MLAAIGVDSIDDLFLDIPEDLRIARLNMPDGLSEMDTLRHLRSLAKRNGRLDEYVSFLGAGAYDHFIPSVVGAITSRGEFATAYTPYQPEVSQRKNCPRLGNYSLSPGGLPGAGPSFGNHRSPARHPVGRLRHTRRGKNNYRRGR